MREERSQTIRVIKADISHLNDVARLFILYREFYNGTAESEISTGFIKERLANNESTVFVAYLNIDGEDVAGGFVQVYPSFSSVSAKRSLILNDLYVHKEYRKMGIGRALMEHARQFAQSEKVNGLSLSTAHDNHKAQALYEALGYKQDKHYLHYFLSVT